MNVELYIDNQLCDLPDPSQMNIILKRVFIKPSELSTKDAQKSYDITLPPTPRNNRIFKHINIEEVQGKFNAYPDARLYSAGVLIMDGKFRLSGIDRSGYRGNLGVPAPLTAKDVFGNTMMNQIGRWLVKFDGVADIATYNNPDYNDAKYGNISPFIIPFALYGLMPRQRADYQEKRDEITYDINFSQLDLPPSVNCMHMIKQIFESAQYKISGSAFDDERLKHLYISYKNPNNYKIEWNVKPLSITARWSSYKNGKSEKVYTSGQYEYEKTKNDKNIYPYLVGNCFNGNNVEVLNIKDDDNKNIRYEEQNISNTDKRTVIYFKVPYKGLYKVDFNATLTLDDTTNQLEYPKVIGSSLDKTKTEIKVVRFKEEEDNHDLNLWKREKFDNIFIYNNQNQGQIQPLVEGYIFPKEGAVNFIDPKQNKDFVCGFSWGIQGKDPNPFINPASSKRHNPMAASGRKSWSKNEQEGNNKKYSLSAVESPGYVKWDGTNFVQTDLFKVDLRNAPPTCTQEVNNKKATGNLSQVTWFEEGETITIMIVTSSAKLRTDSIEWPNQSLEYTLTLNPFMHDKKWLKVDPDPEGTDNDVMYWDEAPTFNPGHLDLASCMPHETKIDDWLNNFCKTFNLELINTGKEKFELNVKNNAVERFAGRIIDLDTKTTAERRSNETLGLPRVFKLGFDAETAEEGYYQSQKKGDSNKIMNSGRFGGGEFPTGSTETSEVEQKSGFSYCWYKTLTTKASNEKIEVPVITDREAWDSANSYTEVKDKRYFNLRQRFWYNTKKNRIMKVVNKDVPLAMVQNRYEDDRHPLSLDYEDKPESIARNYFLLTDNQSSYTIVECNLTADEYNRIFENYVRFNGDLYIVAEVDGYDPLGLRPAKLKLIKRTR